MALFFAFNSFAKNLSKNFIITFQNATLGSLLRNNWKHIFGTKLKKIDGATVLRAICRDVCAILSKNVMWFVLVNYEVYFVFGRAPFGLLPRPSSLVRLLVVFLREKDRGKGRGIGSKRAYVFLILVICFFLFWHWSCVISWTCLDSYSNELGLISSYTCSTCSSSWSEVGAAYLVKSFELNTMQRTINRLTLEGVSNIGLRLFYRICHSFFVSFPVWNKWTFQGDTCLSASASSNLWKSYDCPLVVLFAVLCW